MKNKNSANKNQERENMKKTIVIIDKKIIPSVKTLVDARSDNKTRPSLTAVYVNEWEGGLCLVATDGARLHVLKGAALSALGFLPGEQYNVITSSKSITFLEVENQYTQYDWQKLISKARAERTCSILYNNNKTKL